MEEQALVYANCRRRLPLIGSMTWGKVRWTGDGHGLDDKNNLVLVHGIRETEERLRKVYSEILSRAGASFNGGVGFIWPGGSTIPLWPITVATAIVPSAQRLRDVILEIGPRSKNKRLDINCHSLGCAVTMQMLLQQGRPGQFVENIYMMAPAMQRDLSDYEYVVKRNNIKLHVCFSRDDIVLDTYRLWPPSNVLWSALGKEGPNSWDIAHIPTLNSYDFTGKIGMSHGGYRRTSEYYQMMLNARSNRTGDPLRLPDPDGAGGGNPQGC